PPPGLERRPGRTSPHDQPPPGLLARESASHETGPLRPVETTREPHRPSTPTTGLGGQDRPSPVAGLPPQRRPPLRLHRQRPSRQRRPRPLDRLGPPLPHRRLRRTPTPHRPPPPSHRRRPRPRSPPTPDRSDSHPNPAPHTP